MTDNKRDNNRKGKPGNRRPGSKPESDRSENRRPGDRRTTGGKTRGAYGERNAEDRDSRDRRPDPRKRNTEKSNDDTPRTTGRDNVRKYPATKPFGYRGKRAVADPPKDRRMRLNKYISNAGICSRREADELIKSGLVEVNGKPITEMGYKVETEDIVKYAGEKITPEKPVYFLLNKPKDYTVEMKPTTDGKNGLTLMRGIGNHSVLPVGKMDRTTMGLIIFTNDGELTMKLCNPKLAVKKLYHVHLDKNLKQEHLEALREGVQLEDGFLKAEDISYVGDKKDKKQIGIEIISGRNKAVRHMLEHLGYYVIKLDRVMYAGLSKKDLPRGKWRALTQQEVINLKILK